MKYSLWNMVARGGDGGDGGGGGGSRDSGYTDLGNGYSITPSGDVVSTRDTPLGGGGRDTSMDRANIYDVPAGPPMPTTMQTGGGGGRESPAYSSPTSDNTVAALNAQRAAQEAAAQQAADKAAADNAARIAAERAAYQPPAPEAPSLGLGDIAATLIGITPAEAGTFDVTGPEYQSRYQFNPVPTRSDFEQALDEANVKETLAEAEANAPFARTGFPTGLGLLAKSSDLPAQFTQPAAQTTTFSKDQSGIVPAGVWTDQQMSMPSLRDAAEQARIQAAAAAEPKPDSFYADLQRVNDKLNAIRGMDTSNLVGSGRGIAGPTAAEIAAAAPPRDQFFTDIDRVNAKLDAIRNMNQPVSQPDQTENLIGSGRGVSGPSASEIASAKSPFSAYDNAIVQGTRSPFEAVVESVTKPAVADEQGAMVDAATKANIQRRNDVYSYTPPSSFDPITQQAGAEEGAAAAAPQAPAAKVAATQSAPAKTASSQVAAQAAPVLAIAKKAVAAPVATAPATQAADQGILSKIMADINNANAKRIAELEKAGEFAGGSKEQVAAALGVDPSQLQSRIVNYDGRQKVDYFTKGLDQVLGEMISGPAQALGNLFGSNVNNIPRGSYVRDPRLSDLFTQNVPSKGYGPYGDLTAEEYRQQYGGGGGEMAQAPTPVQAAAAPAVITPVSPALPQALASFKRKYVPITNYATYGYGPESALYEYTAAEGGAVGPLSQKRK